MISAYLKRGAAMVVKKRVALLMGGLSTEREVSLASGKAVLENLDPEKYDVRVFDPAEDLPKFIAEYRNFDLAFPILHGRYGEDGTIQGLFELLKLPYVGSGVLASALAMDKKATKDTLRARGLTVMPELIAVRGTDPNKSVAEAEKFYKYPLVIKPVCQGSSVGLTIAKSFIETREAIEAVWKLEERAMIERYIAGRELTCAVVGNVMARSLPAIEIIPAEGHAFFDYSAKYEPGQAQEICPAPLSDKEKISISNLSVCAHQALGCRGISRTDFILDDRGIFYILEVNTMPGMTNNSLVPRAAAAAKISLAALLDELISLAFKSDHAMP
jgi:D-alanine-D-alanine ligase